MVILGALDISYRDIDVEIDVDADFEVEYEADLEATGEHDISFLNNVLRFFNLKDIPLMFFITFWVFPTLIATVYLNDLLGIESFLFALVVFFPVGFVCLFIAKFTTLHFVKMLFIY